MGIKSLNTLPMEYETGVFTPVIGGAGVAGTPTHTFQFGVYTKIGNVVTFYAKLTWTNLAGASGILAVYGLPYPASTSSTPTVFVAADSLTFTGQLCGFCSSNSNITIYQYASNTTLTGVSIDTEGSLYIQGTYFS